VHSDAKLIRYVFPDASVSLQPHDIDPEDWRFAESKSHIDSLRAKKDKSEAFFGEKVLVNALLRQEKIAKIFGLSKDGLCLSLKPEYLTESDMLMNDFNDVYMLTLDNHIEELKKMGASEEQIPIELSGHIFHEAIHQVDGRLKEELLGGRSPLGEVTSITGQLAYYLAENYKGPKAYDAKCSLLGQKKIKEGKDLSTDHAVATSVAGELLLEQLMVTYPGIAETVETESGTALDTCEAIVAKLSEAERTRLIPCLKEAILQSTDEKKFKGVVARLRDQNSKNKNV
jgi:hypothetical protein